MNADILPLQQPQPPAPSAIHAAAVRCGIDGATLDRGTAAFNRIGGFGPSYAFLAAARELADWAGDHAMRANVESLDVMLTGSFRASPVFAALTAQDHDALALTLFAGGVVVREALDRDGIDPLDYEHMRSTVARSLAQAESLIIEHGRVSTHH